jgi:hypothetical protein
LIGQEYKILLNQLYAQGVDGKNAAILFILLRMRSWTRCQSNPMTHINHSQGRSKHQKHHASYQPSTQLGVAPSENGIWRGSGCRLGAPRLNPGPWGWQTRCPCQMRRGRWPDPLPSFDTLNGGVRVLQLGAERLDLSLGSKQAVA